MLDIRFKDRITTVLNHPSGSRRSVLDTVGELNYAKAALLSHPDYRPKNVRILARDWSHSIGDTDVHNAMFSRATYGGNAHILIWTVEEDLRKPETKEQATRLKRAFTGRLDVKLSGSYEGSKEISPFIQVGSYTVLESPESPHHLIDSPSLDDKVLAVLSSERSSRESLSTVFNKLFNAAGERDVTVDI